MANAAPRSRIRAAGSGVCLAIGDWLSLGVLGLPAILGRGMTGDLLWVGLAGGVIGVVGIAPLLWVILGLSVAGILVVGHSPLFDRRIRDWVRSDALGAGPVDGVVVLSGELTRDGHIGQVAMARLLSGITLRQSLGQPHLILTKFLRTTGGKTLSSEPDQRALVARLDPGATLHIVGPAATTREEAVAIALLATQRGWHRLVLVTSPLHTRRACGALERQGITVVCRGAESRDYSIGNTGGRIDRLAAFRDWIYEVLGAWRYRSKGWLPERANRNEEAA